MTLFVPFSLYFRSTYFEVLLYNTTTSWVFISYEYILIYFIRINPTHYPDTPISIKCFCLTSPFLVVLLLVVVVVVVVVVAVVAVVDNAVITSHHITSPPGMSSIMMSTGLSKSMMALQQSQEDEERAVREGE